MPSSCLVISRFALHSFSPKKMFVFLVISMFCFALDSSFSQEKSEAELQTSFTCLGKIPGYYADVETGCRTYHICDGHTKFSYVCPPRTLFHPQTKICDHWYLVECRDEEAAGGRERGREDEGEARTESSDVSNRLDVVVSPFDERRIENEIEPEEYRTEEWPQSTTFFPTESEEKKKESEENEDGGTTTSGSTEPTTTASPLNLSTGTKNSESSEQSPHLNFLKIKLNDFRVLFYIPETEEENLGKQVSTNIILAPWHKISLMKFRGEKKKSNEKGENSCPSHCDPKFFVSGTCHPCVMIK